MSNQSVFEREATINLIQATTNKQLNSIKQSVTKDNRRSSSPCRRHCLSQPGTEREQERERERGRSLATDDGPHRILRSTLVQIRDWITRERLVTTGVTVVCDMSYHNGTRRHTEWSTIIWLLGCVRMTDLTIWNEPDVSAHLNQLSRMDHWHGIHTLRLGRVTIPNVASSSNLFPSSLTDLRLDSESDHAPMNHVSLPDGLKRLKFGFYWNQPVRGWPKLPASLKTLILESTFNQPLKWFRFPSSLTRLDFHPDGMFNSSMSGCHLPKGVKRLIMPNRWNRPVRKMGQLPSAIEAITFGTQFNRSIDKLLLTMPQSLTELHLRGKFNQPIRGDIFPSRLRSLKLSRRFNQSIRDWKLPSTLTQLRFGPKFDQPIGDLRSDFWPESLCELTWCRHPIVMTLVPSGDPLVSSSNVDSVSEFDSADVSTHVDGDRPFLPAFDLTRPRQSVRTHGEGQVKKEIWMRKQSEAHERGSSWDRGRLQ